MNTLSIIHENTISLEQNYFQVKSIIQEKLGEWSDLYVFDDSKQKIGYKTEGPLIPKNNSKIPILILLSNPHPHSVKQGMFLSPNRIGRENPFWETLKSTGYFDYQGTIDAAVMIKNEYDSPFRFFMAVLFPFPTEDPNHLINYFGAAEYKEMIAASKDDIKNLVTDQVICNIVCFGQTQYDIINSSQNRADGYISKLNAGKMIRDKIWFSEKVNVYLTYPTGWRFVRNYKTFKKESLKRILLMSIQ